MKIKCIANRKEALPKDFLGERGSLYHDFALIQGKEYTVYAIGQINGYIWYCISDEDFISYPKWNPSPLFEITDDRVSQYWVFAFERSEGKMAPIITFAKWAQNKDFYSDLVEAKQGDPADLIFKEYKELMDLEFADASISTTAQIADPEWLLCPSCQEAWQSSSCRPGMVRCPSCKEVMHNPRFISS